MKKMTLLIIFILILAISLVKNSTKEIEDTMFVLNENIRSLKIEFSDEMLEYNFLSSPEKLIQYQSQYFERDLIQIDITKIKKMTQKNNLIKINNFISTFEYLNENNTDKSLSYLTNKTTYNFNDSKSFYFETRKNKKTGLTEFHNLIYQYRNDCLTAAIEYNKDYYSDRDLKPDESIFFKLKIIPFGATSSPNLKR